MPPIDNPKTRMTIRLREALSSRAIHHSPTDFSNFMISNHGVEMAISVSTNSSGLLRRGLAFAQMPHSAIAPQKVCPDYGRHIPFLFKIFRFLLNFFVNVVNCFASNLLKENLCEKNFPTLVKESRHSRQRCTKLLMSIGTKN
jgi:hypothetical protein